MYWCAASSGGDGELVKAKWLSITNHVIDVHEGHSEHFYQCEHGTLEDRKWLKKGKHFISLNTQLPACVVLYCSIGRKMTVVCFCSIGHFYKLSHKYHYTIYCHCYSNIMMYN